jgi:hypothetical protein
METDRQKLLDRREELLNRLAAIRADLASGLDADAEEQAVQLENLEVLSEIRRLAEAELESIEKALAALD